MMQSTLGPYPWIPHHGYCPIADCKVPIRLGKLVCDRHWAMIPRRLQRSVCNAWGEPGRPRLKRAAITAIRWILDLKKRQRDDCGDRAAPSR